MRAISTGTGTKVEGWSISGDDDRCELIRRQVFESRPDPLVLWVARSIVAQCEGRDDECELQAIYQAVKEGPIPLPDEYGQVTQSPGLRFVGDPRYVDAYPSAGKILRWHSQGAIGEDCDGHVILVCSLLDQLGWLVGCVIASRDGQQFVHVFPVAGFPKDEPQDWIPMDTTVDKASVGWWPPSGLVKRMRVYGLTPDYQAKGRELRI
jgi:hypothetical protein